MIIPDACTSRCWPKGSMVGLKTKPPSASRRLDVSQWRRRCSDARELSLMSALRVNCGTGDQRFDGERHRIVEFARPGQ
jgi:hypothetical protein